MGALYCQTTGAATNSGSTDTNAATLSGSAATVAGSVVTLDGSPDLTAVDATAGSATQSTIYLADATNSNLKVFWITAKDNTAKTVTVSVAPTGIASSAWAIGGRLTVAQTAANALRAGDSLTINDTLVATSGTQITSRVAGDQTSGAIVVKGKSGTRPKLESTAATAVSIGHADWTLDNLEIAYSGGGSSTRHGVLANTRTTVRNCKITANSTSSDGVSCSGTAAIIGCNIEVSRDGVTVPAGAPVVIQGCWIHDCGSDTVSTTGVAAATVVILDSILERGVAKGVNQALAGTLIVSNSTIYRHGDSGIEIGAALTGSGVGGLHLFNSILKDNGDAGTEYNVELTSNAYIATGRYNDITIAGALGGGNVSGYTLDATDITTDPLFTDPDNATAASRNFGLSTLSPCKAAGYPGAFEDMTNTTGYLDIGAVQRQEPTSTGTQPKIGW